MTLVLVIDDSRLARMAARRAIAALRPTWQIMEACDVDEAHMTMRGHEVGLLLLDFNMPGQNGLEFAERLRKDGCDTPIVLITANFQDDITRRAQRSTVAFVSKPIALDALEQAIRGVERHPGEPTHHIEPSRS